MKKFEPHYRLVRVGLAKKIEKASRQQRTYTPDLVFHGPYGPRRRIHGHNLGERAMAIVGMELNADFDFTHNRQAAQEPTEDSARYSEGQGCQGQEGEISDSPPCLRFRIVDSAVLPPAASRQFGSTTPVFESVFGRALRGLCWLWLAGIYLPGRQAEGQRGHTHQRCSISHDTAIFDNRDDTIHLKSCSDIPHKICFEVMAS